MGNVYLTRLNDNRHNKKKYIVKSLTITVMNGIMTVVNAQSAVGATGLILKQRNAKK